MDNFNHDGGRAVSSGSSDSEEKEIIAFGACEVAWSERIDNFFEILHPTIGAEWIKNAVESNRFKALEVYLNKQSIGFLIVRIDTLADGSRQFVVLHTLSEVKGKTPLVMIASVLLESLAKKYACTSICCFSDRKAWDGVLNRAGFNYRESIFEKKVEKQ